MDNTEPVKKSERRAEERPDPEQVKPQPPGGYFPDWRVWSSKIAKPLKPGYAVHTIYLTFDKSLTTAHDPDPPCAIPGPGIAFCMGEGGTVNPCSELLDMRLFVDGVQIEVDVYGNANYDYCYFRHFKYSVAIGTIHILDTWIYVKNWATVDRVARIDVFYIP